MKKITLFLTFSLWAYAFDPLVPDNYEISEDKNLSYIYSEEYRPILSDLKKYQQHILDHYSKEYGFHLDATTYVGLASHHNQIGNAYSTQIPLNSQLFFGAGAGYIDYFCFNSWLKTLLLHETAHNFQLNPKENLPSKLSHQVFGNTTFTVLGFLPLFPLPNITESNFMLEGNAVMNESRFGNGGRLYSGYALAEVVALAHADLITPELMYNDTYNFPYGEKAYLVGGFFQQFLAKRYGIEKVNHYFKTYATQMVPLFTNAVFTEEFGKNFETLLAEFVQEIKKEHTDFQPSEGKLISTSQLFVPMNRTDNELYTLVGDRASAPKIQSFDTQNHTVNYQQGAWQTGELFKINNNYYTQTYAKTSPTRITMGLFDKEMYLKQGTEAKAVQGLLSDGRLVYFDILNSLESPQIWIDDEFYDHSHSSVHVDANNNLYYFKQEGKQRRLYKNKTPLFTYEGHYGFVTDVDAEGHIYFIAASKHGSTAYRYNGTGTQRITQGDDVIDLKLIDKDKALIATITADNYEYKIISIQVKNSPVYTLESGLEETNATLTQANILFDKSHAPDAEHYQPLTNLHYSSLAQSISYDEYEGFLLYLQANFTDPLTQNSLTALLSHEKAKTVGGVRYDNQAYALRFGAELFGAQQHEKIADERDHGYSAYLAYPFLAEGYWRATGRLDYTKAYSSIHRKPMSATLTVINNKQFGISKYPNHLNQLHLFASRDRDTQSYGANYNWMHDLGWASYMGLGATYMQSNEVNPYLEKGLRIGNSWGALQSERAEIIMPTIEHDTYAKEVSFSEVSLYKVFETPLYNFSLPLSLRRETLYAKHRCYQIETLKGGRSYNESTLGVESDFLFLHKVPLPINIEWLYNPDTKEDSQIRFYFSGTF